MKKRNWLRAIREEQKTSQELVANNCMISRTHYTNIENGLRNPRPDLAKKIAKTLEFDWTIFYEESDSKTLPQKVI